MDEIPGSRDRDLKWTSACSIIIKERIEELPMEAFAGMKNLQCISLPKNLKKIGFGLF